MREEDTAMGLLKEVSEKYAEHVRLCGVPNTLAHDPKTGEAYDNSVFIPVDLLKRIEAFTR